MDANHPTLRLEQNYANIRDAAWIVDTIGDVIKRCIAETETDTAAAAMLCARIDEICVDHDLVLLDLQRRVNVAVVQTISRLNDVRRSIEPAVST